jgi:putative peptidoglycan lipid II flippase
VLTESAPSSSVTPGERLIRSAGIVGVATMSSRLLGVVREQVLAYLFGAGREMDAFNVAFRVPNLLRDLFAEGAMSAAFVPVFTTYITQRSRSEAWRLGSATLNLMVVTTLAVSVAGMVFAKPVVTLLAGGFADVPGKLELTVWLTRVMFPILTLVAIAAVLMGMLNALQRFFVPSFAPAMFNVGTILCAVALVPVMPAFGWPRIIAVAIGTLIGGALQAGIQWPALRREGFTYSPVFDTADPGVRQMLLLMGPGIIGIAGVQVNLFINTLLATSQGQGAVSWLNYAFRLMYFPIGLFGVSIATASLPTIARAAARQDLQDLRVSLSRALRLIIVLNLPATIGLVVLAEPIVKLLFEHGHFTTADASRTAAALSCYAPGLVGYCAIKLAVPSLYSLRDSRTPVLVSLVGVVSNVAISVVLVRPLGYLGLALGTSIGATINGTLLLVILRKRLGGIDGSRLAVATMKITAASIVMALSTWATIQIGDATTTVARAAHVGAAIAVGVVTLVAAARVLRLRELDEAIAMVTRRRTTPSDSSVS